MAEKKKAGKGRKLGPFPLWVWGLIAVGAAAGFYLYTQNKKKKSGTPTTQTTASSMPGAYASSPAVGTLASQVPQFVNQTYTNNAPPSITQTVNQTNKPQEPPPPVHKTVIINEEEDKRKHTGGWKGQHSNGQGSHHGKPVPVPKPRTQLIQPRPPTQRPGQPKVAYSGINPGGPIRRP